MRYEKYKQTGIPWLPEAPETWEVKKVRLFCTEGKTRNKGNVVSNVLSLSYGRIIRKKDIYSGLIPTDFSTYQIVEEGYVVLRLTDLQNDHKSLRCGLVRERGIITSAYVSLVPKGILPAYLHKILHAWDLFKVFYSMGGGLRQSLNFAELSNIRILVPPLREQRAIVAYLDDKCGKIDELVAAKEKEVELLKELKQRVVADAVTRGISHAESAEFAECVSSPRSLRTLRENNRRLVPSGIPWLPQIPEGWEVKKVRQIAKEGKTKNKGNVEKNVLSLSYGRIIRKKEIYSGLVPTDFATYQIVEKGNVVLRLTDLQNDQRSLRCGLVGERGIITSAYVSLLPGRILSEYLYLILHTCDLHKVFYSLGGGLRQSMNYADVGNIMIPLPPIEKQNAIAELVAKKCEQFDKLTEELAQQVAALKEYKQRLIADVVTGQMRVADE